MGKAEKKLKAYKKANKDLEKSLKESYKSERKLNRKINQLEEKLSKLSKKYKALKEKHEALQKEEKKKTPKSNKSSKTSIKEKKSIDSKKAESSIIQATPKVEKSTDTSSPWGSGDAANKQNLKRIKGIGPATETKMNAIGIFQFAQIGGLKAADLQKLAEALGINVAVIERNEWIKQAKSLSEK
ncbi:MAG: hypothetical protein AAFR87_11720 [Bacteroidota bacterium]